MTDNKMEQVAAMFGKKLNEPFSAYEVDKKGNNISFTENGVPIGNYVMFSKRGVVYVDAPDDEQDWLLIGLLTGMVKIVEDKK